MPNIVALATTGGGKRPRLRVAPVDDTGQIILEEYEKLLGPVPAFVAFSQVSNCARHGNSRQADDRNGAPSRSSRVA